MKTAHAKKIDALMSEYLTDIFNEYKKMDVAKLILTEDLRSINIGKENVIVNIYHDVGKDGVHKFIFQAGKKGILGMKIFVKGFFISTTNEKIDLEEADLYDFT